MFDLNRQSVSSSCLQALSAAINAEVKKPSHRIRYQMVAFDMVTSLGHSREDIDRDMLNRFYERLLPVTLRDWMRPL